MRIAAINDCPISISNGKILKKIKMSCEDDRMCEEVTRCCPMRNFLLFLVLSGIFFLFLPGTALAKENIVKQDSDNDGKIDRIAYFDGAGKISKQEASPFSRPPMNLFKGPIPLEITIIFELT